MSLCQRDGCQTKPKGGAEFCSRHRPKIKREPNKKIQKINEKIKPQKDIRSSNFLITISTNKSDQDENNIDEIDDLNQNLFGEKEMILEFLYDKNGKDIELIDYSVSPGAIEISEKYGRLHFHSLLSIPKHNNILGLDTDKLKSFLESVIGSKCYLNVKIPNKTILDNWREYSIKTL